MLTRRRMLAAADAMVVAVDVERIKAHDEGAAATVNAESADHVYLTSLFPERRTKMKLLAATVMSLSLVASVFAQTSEPGAAPAAGAPSAASSGGSQTVKITRSGSQSSSKAPAEHVTGSARIDRLFHV